MILPYDFYAENIAFRVLLDATTTVDLPDDKNAIKREIRPFSVVIAKSKTFSFFLHPIINILLFLYIFLYF